MTAEIISVGTELLLGTTVDSNAATLGQALARHGITCRHRQTVGDHLGRLTEALQLALSRSDLVITIGGLGPTQDDLTREGIAAALGLPLVAQPALEKHLRAEFERRGLRWVESNLRQTMLPEGAEALSNPHGTAPGLWCESGDKIVTALPGPPREFGPMVAGPLGERLAAKSGSEPIQTRTLKVVGVGESRVEELLADLMAGSHPTLAPYAKTGEVHLRLAAQGSQAAADAVFDPVEAVIRERLGWHVVGRDDESLESRVLDLLASRGETLAVAESLTGGQVVERLCRIPGASRVLVGGVVAYVNTVKRDLLGVQPNTLQEFTAVSGETACEMAEGVRNKLGAAWGLSTTGVAGPGPDSEGHPEGLVFIGLAGPNSTASERHVFGLGREINRARAAQAALIRIYRDLVHI